MSPASLVLFLFFSWALPSGANTTAALPPRARAAMETIDAGDVYTDIAYLSSNRLKGRNAGTPENDKAAEWIAAFFGEMGLEGGGPEGSFFQSFEFPQRGTRGKRAATRNVVALWKGSDPALCNEAVVIGAHFDHVGEKGQKSNPARLGRATKADTIWNGADDNASGTSAVMELAQAFALARVPARRTIVFVCFSAEEHGLYGSRYYVKHPAIPLEKTSAMINLDMVGRNPGKPVMVIGLDSDEDGYFEKALDRAASRVDRFTCTKVDSAFGGSDHWSFLANGVPAIFFFTGFHRDYHRISDEVGKITPERVRNIARVVFLMALDIADRDERLSLDPSFAERIHSRARRRVLGIDLGDKVNPESLAGLGLPEDRGAVRVSGVYGGSVAAKAGIRPGDMILGLGTRFITRKEPLSSLRRAIGTAPAGTDVPVTILRNKEIITLNARWDKPEKRKRKK